MEQQQPQPLKGIDEFLRVRKLYRDQVMIDMVLIDMCEGDHLAALMLGKIIDLYATGPIVWRKDDPGSWVQTSWRLWWKTIRINRRRGARVLKRLKALGYVRCRTFQLANRCTALHAQLQDVRFTEQWNRLLEGKAPLYLEEDPE